jgi:hypothetical protein
VFLASQQVIATRSEPQASGSLESVTFMHQVLAPQEPVLEHPLGVSALLMLVELVLV